MLHRFRVALAGSAFVVASAGIALAGSNNFVSVKQESRPGSVSGNALLIDQSLASNSIVVGPDATFVDQLVNGQFVSREDGSDLQGGSTLNPPALQRGEGNTATINITGDGGQIQLMQDTAPGSAAPGVGPGNDATIVASGQALGAVIQLGVANQANLEIDGGLAGATGLIFQTGTDLNASLQVQPGGAGQIIQNGNGSNAELSVMSGSSVTYTQTGNNLQSVGNAAAQVFSSNPGTITINQTGFVSR